GSGHRDPEVVDGASCRGGEPRGSGQLRFRRGGAPGPDALEGEPRRRGGTDRVPGEGSAALAAAARVAMSHDQGTRGDRIADSFRRWGYLQADLDPLGRLTPQPHAELDAWPSAEAARWRADR